MSTQPRHDSDRISDRNELNVVFAHFPNHVADIKRMRCDPNFRELCEHLAHMYQLEDDASDTEVSRFAELRKSLEHELLEWLDRDPF